MKVGFFGTYSAGTGNSFPHSLWRESLAGSHTSNDRHIYQLSADILKLSSESQSRGVWSDPGGCSRFFQCLQMRVNRRGGLQVHCLTDFAYCRRETAVHNLIFDIFQNFLPVFVIFHMPQLNTSEKFSGYPSHDPLCCLQTLLLKIISHVRFKIANKYSTVFVRKYVRFVLTNACSCIIMLLSKANRCSQQCREVMIMNETRKKSCRRTRAKRVKRYTYLSILLSALCLGGITYNKLTVESDPEESPGTL